MHPHLATHRCDHLLFDKRHCANVENWLVISNVIRQMWLYDSRSEHKNANTYAHICIHILPFNVEWESIKQENSSNAKHIYKKKISPFIYFSFIIPFKMGFKLLNTAKWARMYLLLSFLLLPSFYFFLPSFMFVFNSKKPASFHSFL